MIERFKIGDVARIESMLESSLSEVAGERFWDPSNATVESLTHADLFKMSPNIGKVGYKIQNEQEVETCFHVTRSRNCYLEFSFSIIVFFSSFFFGNDTVIRR